MPSSVKTPLHAIVERAPDLAPATRDKYAHDIDRWCKFAGVDPSGWTGEKVDAWYEHLLTKMRPQTANRMIAALRYASKWWSKRERNPALNFADAIRTKKAVNTDRAERERLSDDDAMALVQACWQHGLTPVNWRDFALVVVGLETGMRRISLADMKFEAMGSPDGYPAINVLIKGGNRHWVPLSDTTLLAMKPWTDWLVEQRRNTGAIWKSLDRRIVTGHARVMWALGGVGERQDGLSETSIYNIVVERAADIKRDVYPHLFRHTFVGTRRAAGVAEDIIAAMTGHRIKELGAMSSYLDRKERSKLARTTTPPWLSDLVARLVRTGAP